MTKLRRLNSHKRQNLSVFQKALVLCFLLSTLFSSSLAAQIVINEITEDDKVEIRNLGTETVDVSTYWLCNFPSYEPIGNLTLICGSTNLEAGQILAVELNSISVNGADGEMGLYTSSSFGSSAAIVDYVEWGNAGHERASVAQAAGIWTAGEFAPVFNDTISLNYDGEGEGASNWMVAAPNICPAPEISVKLADDANLGQILTDKDGNTLYFFTRDAMPDTSLCSGGCLNAWPPFYVASPLIGDGLSNEDFGAVVNSEGQMQTTYKGWPLYYFANDAAPGDTNGEGVNNVWFVAKPDYTIMLLDDFLVGLDGVTYNANYEPGEERVQYFVDDRGRTLYIFTRDTKDQNNFTRSDFSNDPVWPIYQEVLANLPSTLDAGLFGSIDVFGRQQLTYKGWPLYYFGQDSLRGENLGVSFPRPGIWPVAIQDLEPAPEINVKLAANANLGQILTDKDGKTLYFFTRDAMPDTSLCSGGCLNVWPPFYAETIVAGEGLSGGDFGMIVNSEGQMQTTYKGWPLYYFANDAAPGDTNGEGVNNVWFVAKPDYTIMLLDDFLVGLDGVTYDANYEPGEERVQYFVDDRGRTLYIFTRDTKDQNNFTRSDFSNDPVWPIFEEELQSIPSILTDTLFGRIDVFGRGQLTYKGWPLYYFGQDSLRGQTLGVSVPSPGIWPVAIQDLEAAQVTDVKEAFASRMEMRISPIPAEDHVQIRIDSRFSAPMTIQVYDLTGRQKRTVPMELGVGRNTMELDLSGFSSGLYILVVHIDNQLAAYQKFVKK